MALFSNHQFFQLPKQVPIKQVALLQSEVFMHVWLILHRRAHIEPPQSISVSSWFLILSVQVAGT